MNQENNNNRIDLSKRLSEPATKSQSGQWSSGPYVSPFAPKIIRWLIRYSGGLVKNEKQVLYVVLGFIVLAVIISLFLIFGREGGGKTPEETFAPPAEAPAEEVVPPSF